MPALAVGPSVVLQCAHGDILHALRQSTVADTSQRHPSLTQCLPPGKVGRTFALRGHLRLVGGPGKLVLDFFLKLQQPAAQISIQQWRAEGHPNGIVSLLQVAVEERIASLRQILNA